MTNIHETLATNIHLDDQPSSFANLLMMRQAALNKLLATIGENEPSEKQKKEVDAYQADIEKLQEMITRSN